MPVPTRRQHFTTIEQPHRSGGSGHHTRYRVADDERAQTTAALVAQLRDELRADPDGPERTRLVNRLVVVNLGVADAIASRYAGRGIPQEDLVQVARLALVRAAHRFDPVDWSDFLAYAVPSIRGELRRHFRDHGWTVRPPRRIQEAQLRMNAARGRLGQELGREPVATDFCAALDLDEGTVVEALRVNDCYHPRSLDRPESAASSHYGQPQQALGARLGAEDQGYGRSEARLLLGPLVARLAERDRLVLRLRFVDGLTQREIGDRMGVTQVQISRVLSRVLAQLRQSIGLPVTA